LTLDYEVRLHLFYNVDVVYVFHEVHPMGGKDLGV
jgi:hypothetical protein